ncbi:hypothetical protein LX66_2957 [Chitinophaga japonensis]|uniref:Lipoprotein n=2 Tax=Chitinophaga japonensis TaxID=104662 RepID=A0A562T7F3_CHIJA|nr:hypothetical protein LX66_2957 [Chitinophaga japonensis]
MNKMINFMKEFTEAILVCLVILLAGCKDRSLDTDGLADEYCECMEKNGARQDYYNARVICDSKFILKNRFFKINYIDALYGRYMVTLEKETKDSVIKFNYDFFIKVSERCPYVYKADSIREAYRERLRP